MGPAAAKCLPGFLVCGMTQITMSKISRIISLCGALLVSDALLADEYDDFELDAPFVLDDDIPVVLTASRLKQPRAEVPASVTVIEAAQIAAWGVRTLPELMRFVPGMSMGHGDDENNASIAYHASNPSIMRRLQVLVDGRSVFKAGIASVVWDDIPVAMEDILRIEVTRGPNAASYGANSFLGVINIVTKHPGDTLGTRVRYRNGNNGVDDAFVSYSGESNQNSYRITAQIRADDGYDGRYARNGDDDYRDSKRHGFITAYFNRPVDSTTQLNMQASLKQGHTDIRRESYELDAPDQDTHQGYLWTRLRKEFSTDHSSHLQAYWQVDNRQQLSAACLPTISLDPGLFALYQENPQWANTVFGISMLVGTTPGDQLIGGIATGAVTPDQVEAAVLASQGTELDITQEQLDSAGAIYLRGFNGSDFSQLKQTACGDTRREMREERYDIEWQDTVQWSDTFRTVSGASFRRDQVDSETYFNGKVHNDTYRLFANAEWRMTSYLLLNAGGMYEMEDTNDNAFSPRIALNWLLAPQHSIRLVYSEAVRSPDLLEQDPEYSVRVRNLESNYLNLSDSRIFVNQTPDSRDLQHEKIASTEIGYYGKFSDLNLEMDVKVYQDKLTQLISDHIALNSLSVESDTKMNVNGAEMQLQWQADSHNWFWMTAAYIDADVTLGDTSELTEKQRRSLSVVELRQTAKDNLVMSWHHQGEDWSLTASHFWLDAYNGSNRYRRYEINTRKTWSIGRYHPWAGFFVQHLIDDNSLTYADQRYSTRDLYYFQVGLDF
jgi:iron complex outermembrane receptor protein